MEATSNFTAMVYRNGQTFGIRENIQGSWYYLDFTDPTKSNLVIHSQEKQVKEFLNCQKTSPLLDQVSPSSAPNASVSSGDQSSALSPIGDQTTSGDIGIGSTHKNGTTSATPEKSNLKSKGRPNEDKDKSAATDSTATAEPKSKAPPEPSDADKGSDIKKSIEPFFICTAVHNTVWCQLYFGTTGCRFFSSTFWCQYHSIGCQRLCGTTDFSSAVGAASPASQTPAISTSAGGNTSQGSGVSATTAQSAASPASQSSGVSTTTAGSASTGQSGGSPASQTPAVSATGASGASSSPAQTTVTTGPVNTGFDFCALSSPKLIDAFTIGNTIYFG
ncbi:unnamed protein product, partial [Medioppia subpectinata]